MERGYVKLWRKAMESGLIENAHAWQLFGYLLLSANHKERKFSSNGVIVSLNAGDAIFSRVAVSKKLKISEKNARTALDFLKKLEIVATKPTNKFTIVSFVNWDTYQNEGPTDGPTNSPSTGQQVATTQECKNNNIKNTSYSLSEKLSDDAQEQASPIGEELPLGVKARRKSPVPNCPQEKIIELYHKCLPELAQVRAWSKTNETNMRSRWRDRWSEKKYCTVEEGLAYWEQVFKWVHDHCPWLMGKNDREWKMDLAWFMKESNFTKFLNRKYDDRAA